MQTLHGKGSICCGNSDSTSQNIICCSCLEVFLAYKPHTDYWLSYLWEWKLRVPLIMEHRVYYTMQQNTVNTTVKPTHQFSRFCFWSMTFFDILDYHSTFNSVFGLLCHRWLLNSRCLHMQQFILAHFSTVKCTWFHKFLLVIEGTNLCCGLRCKILISFNYDCW